LFVVTGPSGVGKSTLIQAALARIPGLAFSISATTRGPRPGEVNGREYIFLSEEEFQRRVDQGAFIEHATVYGRSYGTLRVPTERALSEGRSLVLDIDAQGARQVRERWPSGVHLFLLPPDIHTLERRLRGRGTDSEAVIQRRMAEMSAQLSACDAFDYLVLNEDLDTAHATLQGIFLAELSRRTRRGSWVQRVQQGLAERAGGKVSPTPRVGGDEALGSQGGSQVP